MSGEPHAKYLAAVVAAVVSLQGACTTVLYKGASRPTSQIAVIMSQDTTVEKVDNLVVRDMASGNYARFEVLPGLHRVGISLNKVNPGFFYSTVQRSDYIVVCVELEAGHVYKTQPVINGERWVPRVVDENTHKSIDPYCDEDVDEKPVAVAPNAAAAPMAAASPDAGVAPVDAGAPPTVAVADGGTEAPVASAEPVAAPVAAPVANAAPAVPPLVRRRPRRALARAGTPESSDAQLSGRHPGSGLTLSIGFGFGGDNFITASNSSGGSESLNAGTGLILGLGGMVTPLWPTETVGLGLGVDGALKYDNIDAANGSASITRYPLAFTAHLLTNGSGGQHYFILKGGLIRDFGVTYNLSGTETHPDGTWGPTGSLGYYKRSNDFFAWDVLGFFAITNHVLGTEKLDANSFGVTMGFHLNP